MNNRERFKAVMHYEKYDRLPLAHFGFWHETLVKWANEGHIPVDIINKVSDGNEYDAMIAEKLGFDFNYFTVYSDRNSLYPLFETRIKEYLPDGYMNVFNAFGVTELRREGAGSIPAEVDHTLKDRESFEKEFMHRLTFGEHRINNTLIDEYISKNETRTNPLGLHCGSLYGDVRNWAGLEGLCYLYADDEELFKDIIDKVGELTYQYTEALLKSGIEFDFLHFWEDICFKNGPLVSPSVFREFVAPHYKRISELGKSYGIDIVSVDCDGDISSLVDIWVENGVNTMFPIEYGTWEGNIGNFKAKHGQNIRGVGGMNKNVFALEYSDIDREIERLHPLIEMGGYIPCPDHRIPPDAKWSNIQYYCDKMKKLF